MFEQLQQKLTKKDYSLTYNQLTWLFEHLGASDSRIRDDLVYRFFAYALSEGSLTSSQFRFLVEQTTQRNSLFYHIEQGLPATVTRSFAALLNGLLIHVDNQPHSPYFNQLMATERTYFFHASLAYLQEEHDFTSYSSSYGWVHAFAHGADFLGFCLLHDQFPPALKPEIFTVISTLFKNLPTVFLGGEEQRLATVFYEALKANRLSSQELAQWIQQQTFPIGDDQTTNRRFAFHRFLAAIYFHLVDTNFLDKNLKKALLNHLKDF